MLLLLAFTTVSAFTVWLAEQGAVLCLAGSLDGLALTLSSVAPVSSALRRRRGRPRKFATPSRAVTLTLPESVIAMLSSVNPDLSRAVVTVTKRVPVNGHPPAELAVFGNRAVITIRPTRSLEQRAGVHLVPLPDGRALISFDQPKSIADLELLLLDALEDPALGAEDRRVFEGIEAILREARRSNDVALVNRSIIVLESSKRLRKTGAVATATDTRGEREPRRPRKS